MVKLLGRRQAQARDSTDSRQKKIAGPLLDKFRDIRTMSLYVSDVSLLQRVDERRGLINKTLTKLR